MFRALHTSRSGMKAYQDKLDVISNNLANIQTDGYKRIDTDFVSLLKDSIKGQGSDDEGKPLESIPLGTGVMPTEILTREFWWLMKAPWLWL